MVDFHANSADPRKGPAPVMLPKILFVRFFFGGSSGQPPFIFHASVKAQIEKNTNV